MSCQYGIAALLCIALTSAPVLAQSDSASHSRANPEGASAIAGKAVAYSDVDMVSTANPNATAAALQILRVGGSAMDAAITAQLVLNLVEPQSSGIGGGAFLLAFDAGTSQLRVYDGRETAPDAAFPDQFLKPDGSRHRFFDAVDSGLSVGVPGLVRMLAMAHEKHGKLPWADLFQPAIQLADEGFAISPRLFQSVKRRVKRIAAQPVASDYFLTDTGQPKAIGTIVRNVEFADVLRDIAEDGPNAFYTGRNAAAIVNAVKSHNRLPGAMTHEDLAGYRAIERIPLCHPYRQLQICGMPPPSSGALTLLQSLALFQELNLSATDPNSIEAVHLMSEAYRLAYADRALYIADPDFVDVPVEGLLDPAYTRARAALVSPRRSMGKPSAGQPAGAPVAGLDVSRELPGTTHLSIVDVNGNAISMTSSIETAFGSMLMVRGYLLNNQLTDFSFAPSDKAGRAIANRVQPGKRPRSSMAPTVILDSTGRLEGVLGSPGGSSIIQYVAGTLVGMLDWRLDVQQAINLPHFGAKTSATTTIEKGSGIVDLTAALNAMGHKVRARPLSSGIHAVVFNGLRADGSLGALARGQRRSRWAGGADPRREGLAAGN